jgi:hypothetical protein
MSKVEQPNVVQPFPDLDSDLSTTIATGLWKQAAAVQEYLNRSMPVGTVIWFEDTVAGIPESPDPKYWHEMDGTGCLNPNSVFNGFTIPNLNNLFLKETPASGATVQTSAGSHTRSFTHTHGTSFTTGSNDAELNSDYDYDTNIWTVYSHRHTVNNNTENLSNVDIRPAHRKLRFFLRIV